MSPKQKYLLFSILVLLLLGFSKNTYSTEIAQIDENEEKLKAEIAKVYTSLMSFRYPERCKFIKKAEAISYGWELELGNYQEAIYELKKQAVLNGANVADIEMNKGPISLTLSQQLSKTTPVLPYFHYHVYGRLYKCPL